MTTEPLAPLSDERVRELTQLTRNGPEVVAMAQEVERSRVQLVRLRSHLLDAVMMKYVRDIALALGLPADAEPDAVLTAVTAAAKDRTRLRDGFRSVLIQIRNHSMVWAQGAEGVCIQSVDDIARAGIEAIDAANKGAKR